MEYIHDLDEWPAFRWDEARLTAPLAELHRRQGRLYGRMEALGFSPREHATLQTLTSDILKSSEIEGEVLDLEQVRSSLARRLGIDIGALKPADRNVDGVVEMMLDATQRYDKPLTAERLCGWQASLFPDGRSGLSRIVTGRWREPDGDPMQMVSGPMGREHVHFEAPAAARLPAEMARFLAWFNNNKPMDPIVRAALAHLWFVTVHPFEDGNGRIARAVGDLALARADDSPQRFYSLSSQIRAERADYYRQLETAQKGDLDITSWLVWFIACLGRAIDNADTVTGSVVARARFWEGHAEESFNPRQRLMLNRLFDGFDGKLTSSKWATLTKCSQDTAGRDIDDLMRRGILLRDTAGGRSTSYSLI